MSMPGATSVSSKPSGVRRRTHRSVTIEHGLAALSGIGAGEGAMLHLGDELADRPLPHDLEAAIANLNLERSRHEGADKNDGLGVLADVDETASARKTRTKARYVEIAVPIDLGEAEEGTIEPAAVVEIELVGLVDDRLRVGGGAEVQAGRRHAADHAGLGRHASRDR